MDIQYKMHFPCLAIDELPDPMPLTLPGGVSIEHINLVEQVQPYLTPLMPVFNIIDAIVALFNCVKAIPDTIGPPPDPTILAECIPELSKKVSQLLGLLPQLSLPMMLVQLLDLLIDTLKQARDVLVHLQSQIEWIERAVDRAMDLDDARLMAIAECAQRNVEQESANVSKALGSLGKLIGLINIFMSMVGGPEIPDFSSLSGVPLDEVIEPLDALIKALETARELIPIP